MPTRARPASPRRNTCNAGFAGFFPRPSNDIIAGDPRTTTFISQLYPQPQGFSLGARPLATSHQLLFPALRRDHLSSALVEIGALASPREHLFHRSRAVDQSVQFGDLAWRQPFPSLGGTAAVAEELAYFTQREAAFFGVFEHSEAP